MKKALKYVLCAGVASIFAACAPMEPKKPDIGEAPGINSIETKVTQGDQPYRYVFEVLTPGVVGIWDFGNAGGVQVGNKVTVDFAFSGDRTVSLKAYNKGGMSKESKQVSFTVEQGSATIPGTPGYYLTLGPWVWDKETQGHWGNGNQTSTAPHWDNAAPNSRPAEQYDDVMHFNTDGSFVLETNGYVVSNEEPLKAGMFGDEWKGATTSTVIPYTMPADADWTWSVSSGTTSSMPFT